MANRQYDWAQAAPVEPDVPVDTVNGEDNAAQLLALAEQIRQACIAAARSSYEDAAANGLCAEGAWECAVDAMHHVDLVVQLQTLGVQNSKR